MAKYNQLTTFGDISMVNTAGATGNPLFAGGVSAAVIRGTILQKQTLSVVSGTNVSIPATVGIARVDVIDAAGGASASYIISGTASGSGGWRNWPARTNRQRVRRQ